MIHPPRHFAARRIARHRGAAAGTGRVRAAVAARPGGAGTMLERLLLPLATVLPVLGALALLR
jgi:hypothetical protein